MNIFGKTLGLLLASLALASCGGGGGDGGAFTGPQSGTITLSATTTTLPLNTGNELPSQHGSSQAEVTITLRHADGTLMAGSDVHLSISPVNVAAISVLNDGTATVDDLWGTYPITGTNGVATAWVNSRQTAGTAVLTASTQDPTTSRTISATLTFTVLSGVGPAPANVELVSNRSGVYLPSSGGNNTAVITATVRDGGNQLVPDPVDGNAGVDNVLARGAPVNEFTGMIRKNRLESAEQRHDRDRGLVEFADRRDVKELSLREFIDHVSLILRDNAELTLSLG